MSQPAVFLDRDGTLIEERNYPSNVADIVAMPGSGQGLRRLANAGYLCIVLTNQSAVARGYIDEEKLGELHADLARQLDGAGRSYDALYYCPHHPEGTAVGYNFPCACRKPGPGLLELALEKHDIDLSRSAFIGDATRDLFLDAGPALARILVESGHALERPECADFVAPTVVEAIDWLLESHPQPRRQAEAEAEAAAEAEAEAAAALAAEQSADEPPHVPSAPESVTGASDDDQQPARQTPPDLPEA